MIDMDLLTILLMAVGLAMDCFAVSVAQGLDTNVRDRKVWPQIGLMAFLFGFFQGAMPLIGYYAGSLFTDFFDTYAPWIAMIILAFLGGKMILEAAREKNEEQPHKANWKMGYLLVMAVATSIDALATGVVFIPYPEYLWIGVGLIALVSFGFSIVGCQIGSESKKLLQVNPGFIGGIILIGIGIKIFVEGVLL